jgi:hypothetical protein
MKRLAKARNIKSGETVLDRGRRFIIKEVCVSAEPGRLAFIDMQDVWHGNYHPDEYLAVGGGTPPANVRNLGLADSTRAYLLANMPSEMIH